MDSEYLKSLPPELIHPAACLYVDALKDKIGPVLGDPATAIRVLTRHLVPVHCLTAICNNKLVGLLGVQTAQGGFFSPSVASIVSEYGLVEGIYRYMGLFFLHHKVVSDEWHVDGIAVEKTMRGKNIGTALLEYLEIMARENGIRRISLDVIDTNRKARSLYSRLGFVETSQSAIWPFNHIYEFPFKTVITMEKEITCNREETDGNSQGFREDARKTY